MTTLGEAVVILQGHVAADRRPEGERLRHALDDWLEVTPLSADEPNYDRRDQRVVAAVERCCKRKTTHGNAQQLAAALKIFFDGRWREDRFKPTIDYLDTLEGHCWKILKAVPTPIGARQIRRILDMAAGDGQRPSR